METIPNTPFILLIPKIFKIIPESVRMITKLSQLILTALYTYILGISYDISVLMHSGSGIILVIFGINGIFGIVSMPCI